MGNNGTAYDDVRLTEIEAEKQQMLTETENTYNDMIEGSGEFYQEQKNASNDWAEKQTELQNEQTNFAVEQIEQQKELAEKDYQKEQRAAYVDYQQQSNEYSVGAERRAESGLSRSGYSESSQVAMYTAYQHRVSVAREALQKTFQNYDNQMAEARLQNSVALAQLAHDNLMTQLQLDMEAFQYGNQLLLEKLNSKLNINTTYHGMHQNIVSQINQEKALAEEIRQFNESKALQEKQLAEEQRQFDAQMAEEQRQYNEQLAYTKSKSSGSGSSGSGSTGSVGNEAGYKVELENTGENTSKKNSSNPINKLLGNNTSKVVVQTQPITSLPPAQAVLQTQKGYSLVKDILNKGIK